MPKKDQLAGFKMPHGPYAGRPLAECPDDTLHNFASDPDNESYGCFPLVLAYLGIEAPVKSMTLEEVSQAEVDKLKEERAQAARELAELNKKKAEAEKALAEIESKTKASEPSAPTPSEPKKDEPKKDEGKNQPKGK